MSAAERMMSIMPLMRRGRVALCLPSETFAVSLARLGWLMAKAISSEEAVMREPHSEQMVVRCVIS